MSFSLKLQDPGSDASTLLELIVEAAAEMDRGVGMFSFASANGVKLLLGDPDFKAFLQRGQFELIVGVDAVTVPAALLLLRKFEETYARLTVRVFVHKRPGTLFHPKFIWFAGGGIGRVLVGSGNLTRGGLLKNWEAFAHAVVDQEQLTAIESQWAAWRDLNDERLRPVNDADALARAQENEGRERRHEEEEVEEADTVADVEPIAAPVLLAEIPKGERWKQAGFSLDIFRGFFELEPGTFRRVVLYPVGADGTVGAPETRQSVSVRSQNYRIELGQVAGLAYPKQGKPIGLFLKTGTRQFRYRVLMPGDAGYADVSAVMAAQWNGRPDHMKRIPLDSEQFRHLLPNITL